MKTWANLATKWELVGSTWATIFLQPAPTPQPPLPPPGVQITTFGTGDLGPVVQGWTVSEFATPNIIGDQTAGTGDVVFTTGRGENSLVVINNNSRLDHYDPAGDLGFVEGIIRTVNEQGLAVNVNQSTPLERFNTDRFIPPLGVGSAWSALDLALQLTGFVYLTPNPYES